MRQFRELFIVYIGSVKSNQFLIGVSFWDKCKLIMTGCGCELDIAWNILISKYLCMYFYSTLLLTSLGLRPTPLKTRLENRLIVVESIIFRFFSIWAVHNLGCPSKAHGGISHIGSYRSNRISRNLDVYLHLTRYFDKGNALNQDD